MFLGFGLSSNFQLLSWWPNLQTQLPKVNPSAGIVLAGSEGKMLYRDSVLGFWRGSNPTLFPQTLTILNLRFETQKPKPQKYTTYTLKILSLNPKSLYLTQTPSTSRPRTAFCVA